MAKQRVAIVTGASGGLGEEAAKQLARDGYAVAMVARRLDELTRVKADIAAEGGKAEAFECNLAKVEQLTSVVEQIQKAMGTVSTVVNNAAIGPSGKKVDTIPLKEWDLAMSLNVRAPFLMAQMLFPAMQKQGFGRMINISSLLGVTGAENTAMYATSKHAIIGLTRALAAEWGREGITSNVICPGYFKTPGLDAYDQKSYEVSMLSQRIPMPGGRMGDPKEMAKLIGFIAQEDAHYMNGAVIISDGGLMADMGIK